MKKIAQFFKEILILFMLLWLIVSATITLVFSSILVILYLCGDGIDSKATILSIFGISTSLYFLFTIGSENARKFFAKRLWK